MCLRIIVNKIFLLISFFECFLILQDILGISLLGRYVESYKASNFLK
jgi:hypothetical protein